MHFNDSYILPFMLSVALHALVIAAMAVNWERKPAIDAVSGRQYYIEASVVRENPHEVRKRETEQAAARIRAARQKEAEARESDQRRKREQAQVEKETMEQQRNPRELQLPELAEIPKLEDYSKESSETDPLREAERRRMEENLVMDIMKEQEYRRAVTADEKAMAYVAQIKRDIARNWSRPPSARRDMEAMLRVHLVPTGEVVNVTVAKSSGNEAFDRSAVRAVEKVDRFQVPTDSAQFERNFREFNVLFRPEDLRL